MNAIKTKKAKFLSYKLYYKLIFFYLWLVNLIKESNNISSPNLSVGIPKRLFKYFNLVFFINNAVEIKVF